MSSQLPSTSAAEAVGAALVESGATHIFGLLGSGNFEIADAAVARGASFWSSRHEAPAVAMADGYSRSTGRVGIATVHHGPGLTNALTALTEAAKSSTPLVLVTAAPATADPWSNFAIDQDALVAAAGAGAVRIERAADARRLTLDAVRCAGLDSRPVVLTIPVDVQRERRWRQFDRVNAGGSSPSSGSAQAPSQADVSAVSDIIQGSKRALILAGRGAVEDSTREALLSLGSRMGALLATTAGAASLFEGEPYNLGIAGGFASPSARRLIREADLMLAFGASLNPWTMHHGRLVGDRMRIVQVDRRGDALGRQHRVDLAIHADAELAARAIDGELATRPPAAESFRAGLGPSDTARGWASEPFAEQNAPDRIDPRVLTIELNRRLPSDRTVAIDSGLFMAYPAAYLTAPDPQGFLFAQGFMSVGLGLGVGLGGAIGRPDRVTVAALGDGGALMSLAEFETLARYRPLMIVVIYNDNAYSAEVADFGSSVHHDGLVRFPDTDFAGLAHALGMRAVTVRGVGDLDVVDRWLDDRHGPLVVDAKINPVVVSNVWTS